MNLPPELEREIEIALKEECEDHPNCDECKDFTKWARFGMSLMLKKVLEDLRSEDAGFDFEKYPGVAGPNYFADWLETRYTKKESEEEDETRT